MKKKERRFTDRHGFTMIEVIVVLVILAIIAAFAIPTYLGFVKDSQAKECAAYTAMLTRDCQQAQKNLTDSPTRIVKIDETLRNKIFFQAIFDEFNVNLESGGTPDITVIDKDGKKMVAGICQDGGNYYTQIDNGNINVYCDKHDGLIPDVKTDVIDDGSSVIINYVSSVGGSVSKTSETISASNGSVSGSTASANSGYGFVNWTRNGTVVSTESAFKPIPNAAGKFESATYTANFSENQVTISYVAGIGGTVNPTEERIKTLTGTPIGCTATPETGYKFSEWVDSSGTRVETSMTFYPQKVGSSYTTTTYRAIFIKLENVAVVGDVRGYFDDLYSSWDYSGFIWWYVTTEKGAVYSYTSPFFGIEFGTYVSVDNLDQDFISLLPTTDNFYRWLRLEDQKKFIRITSSTPVYKKSNVNGSTWTTTQPSFGNLYEYGDSVYIWTSDNPAIIPSTDPTSTSINNYWLKIVRK